MSLRSPFSAPVSCASSRQSCGRNDNSTSQSSSTVPASVSLHPQVRIRRPRRENKLAPMEVTPAARLRRLHCMPALCWHPRACGRACAPRATPDLAAGSRSPLRTVLRQDENRLVDREQALRIRPPSASSAPRIADDAVHRSTNVRPATRTRADPASTSMSPGRHAVCGPAHAAVVPAGSAFNPALQRPRDPRGSPRGLGAPFQSAGERGSPPEVRLLLRRRRTLDDRVGARRHPSSRWARAPVSLGPRMTRWPSVTTQPGSHHRVSSWFMSAPFPPPPPPPVSGQSWRRALVLRAYPAPLVALRQRASSTITPTASTTSRPSWARCLPNRGRRALHWPPPRASAVDST